MWHNLLHICACVLKYTKFASFTFDYHVRIGVACHEAHRFPYPLDIPPKVTSHVIFWAAKMVNTKCSEKRVVTSTHLFFSIWHSVWLRGMNSTFLWYEWVCVRATRPLSIHITVSNLHLLYYFPTKKYIYTYSWEQCHIYRTHFDPKSVMSFACDIVCCYVSFLFRIYSMVAHMCMLLRLFFSFFLC